MKITIPPRPRKILPGFGSNSVTLTVTVRINQHGRLESNKDPTKPTTKKTTSPSTSSSSTTSTSQATSKITAKTTRKTTKAPNKEGMGILNPNLRKDEVDAAIKDIRLAHPEIDLNATWAIPKKWMSSRSLMPESHKALGTILNALSTAKVKLDQQSPI